VAKDFAMRVTNGKIVRILLMLVFVVVFACGLNIWAQTSPVVDDYKWIQKRDTELGLVAAFATALRINHPAAYDMIDPSLKSKLDEWMNTHPSKKCAYQADSFSIWPATKEGNKSSLICFGVNNRWLTFRIDNIVVKNLRVMDWGDVTEIEE
jgi:hypothetical protein